MTCIAPNSPAKLTLILSGNKTDMDAELVKLSVAQSGAKPQDFKLDGRIFFDGLSSALELMDVNFDGFDDIKLATSTSAGPNMGYEYWVYVPKTGQFAATKLGEQLSGFDVIPDVKTNTIKVTSRSNCCSWNTSTFGWTGATLRLHTSEDAGEFSPTDLPGLDSMEQTLCGSETKSFNDAGRITRIDMMLGSSGDFECSKDTLAGQKGLLDRIKQAGNGYHVDAKNAGHFTIVFDKPKTSSP